MRLIPTNNVGQACERVSLPRLPREACYDQERGQSKVEKDTETLNEEQGEVLPWRRTKRRTGGVWRAERRCQWRCQHGEARDELHFTFNEEKGEILSWRRTRRRLRCGSMSSRVRCQLVKLTLMLHELDIGMQ